MTVSSVSGSHYLDLSKLEPATEISQIFIKKHRAGDEYFHPFGVKRPRSYTDTERVISSNPECILFADSGAFISINPKSIVSTNPESAVSTTIPESILSPNIPESAVSTTIPESILSTKLATPESIATVVSSVGPAGGSQQPFPQVREPSSLLTINPGPVTYSMIVGIDSKAYRFSFGPDSSHADIIEQELSVPVLRNDQCREAMRNILRALSADDVDAFNGIKDNFLKVFNIKDFHEFHRFGLKQYLYRYAFLFGASKILCSLKRYFHSKLQTELINLDMVKYLIGTKPPGVTLSTLIVLYPYLDTTNLLNESLELFMQSSPSLNYFQRVLLKHHNIVGPYTEVSSWFSDDSLSDLEIFSRMCRYAYSVSRPFGSIIMNIFQERFRELFTQCKDSVKKSYLRAVFDRDDDELLRMIYENDKKIIGIVDGQGNLLDKTIERNAKNCFRYLLQIAPALLTKVSKQKKMSSFQNICLYHMPYFLDILIEMDEKYLDMVVFTDESKSYTIVQYAFLTRNTVILRHLCEKRDKDETIGRLLLIWESPEDLIIHSLDKSFEYYFTKFVFELLDVQLNPIQVEFFRSGFNHNSIIQNIRSNGLSKVLENITNSSIDLEPVSQATIDPLGA